MEYLALTLGSPAENLALDQALLEAAEQGAGPSHVLRLWEADRPMVVLGRSSRVGDEVDECACRRRGVPVLRRTSGGATVVAGPGCLMYAVVLSLNDLPSLRAIDQAHTHVLDRQVDSIRPLCPGVARAGTSDLVLGDRKFSGNSLRIKQRHLLYHGTILYDFPLSSVTALLKSPPRQPAYRRGRDHRAFLTNLPTCGADLRQALLQGWHARPATGAWPRNLVTQLVADRYATAAWTHAF